MCIHIYIPIYIYMLVSWEAAPLNRSPCTVWGEMHDTCPE